MRAYKFIIVDREDCVDGFDTLSEAEEEVKRFEAEDIENDCFIEGAYEIYEIVEDGGYSSYYIGGVGYRLV